MAYVDKMNAVGPVKAVQLAWGRTDVGMVTTSTTSIVLQLHDDLYVQQRRSVPGLTPRDEQKFV
jgi:hypothetical protein